MKCYNKNCYMFAVPNDGYECSEINFCKIRICEPNSKKETSVINHPAHYNNGLYECIDLMREIYGDEIVRSFCILNAYKYRFRAGTKQGATANDDIAKAEWYEAYVMEKIPQNYAAWADRRNKHNTCKEDRSEKDAE